MRAVKVRAGTDRPDLRRREDDADGIVSCRDQPGTCRARFAVWRKVARPGQQAQFGEARRIDDEVVIASHVGQKPPMALPVVRLPHEDHRMRRE